VYAMCAVDALGIPFMVDRDARIASVDPRSGQRVVVTVAAGVAVFDPDETVMVYAATSTGNGASNGGGGRSVDTCCSTINFFTDSMSARTWLDARPDLTATVLGQDGAVALGRDIFGPLLREPNP
jgi:hypothetical protein